MALTKVSLLDDVVSVGYSSNVTGNVSVTRGLAVGYTDGKVPPANLTVTGNASISGLSYPTSDGSVGQVIKTDGSGTLSFASHSAVVNAGDVLSFYSANTTGNVRFARGAAIGYANSKVPGANLDVKGNTVISSNLVASSVDVTNYLKVGDGAVAQPSIANLGDGNTGIWFPAADALAVSTSGSERARVLATGNVAIASTTDHATLGVTGDLYVSGDGRVPAPINVYTATSQTLTIFDAGAVLDITNASAITLTVPPNSSVAFPVGTIVAAVQMGGGAITWTQGSGVTIRNRNGLVTQGQYAVSSVVKLATDEWAAAGDLTT